MVGVGILAAVLNITTLFLAVLAERAIERIICTFAISRLKSTRRAPVVHDSDAWLFNFPRSLFKYYRYPAILFTIICGFLLIAFEMVSELGVNTSTKCTVQHHVGPVIKPGPVLRHVARVNLVATASGLQQIKFEDGDMRVLVAGTPKLLSGAVCLSCLNVSAARVILANCSAVRGRTYPAGTMFVGSSASPGPFYVTTTGFRLTEGPRSDRVVATFTGDGDIIHSGTYCCSFLISAVQPQPAGPVTLTYFEYAHQRHCSSMFFGASAATVPNSSALADPDSAIRNTPVAWQRTQGPVHTHRITCARNELSVGSLQAAVQAYRSIQLENVLVPATFFRDRDEFQFITTDDVYRAALSLKLAEATFERGEYHIYTECGQYDWLFVCPMLTVVALLIVLGAAAAYQSTKEPRISVPYNSRTWYDELLHRVHHSQQQQHGGRLARQPHHRRTPRPFHSWKLDEMVLVGEQPDVQVDYCFNRLRTSESFVIKQMRPPELPATPDEHDEPDRKGTHDDDEARDSSPFRGSLNKAFADDNSDCRTETTDCISEASPVSLLRKGSGKSALNKYDC